MKNDARAVASSHVDWTRAASGSAFAEITCSSVERQCISSCQLAGTSLLCKARSTNRRPTLQKSHSGDNPRATSDLRPTLWQKSRRSRRSSVWSSICESLLWTRFLRFSSPRSIKKESGFMPYQSVNPATGELLQVFPEHTDQKCWMRWQPQTRLIAKFGPLSRTKSALNTSAEQPRSCWSRKRIWPALSQ